MLALVTTPIVLFVVIFYLADKPYLQAIVSAGFIMTQIIVYILTTRNQESRDLIQKREKHSSDLHDVYKRLLYIYPREEHDQSIGFKVPVRYEESFNYFLPGLEEEPPSLMSIDKIENFDWAMDHLRDRKYQDIYNAWVETDKYREHISESSRRLSPLFVRVAQEKISRAFPTFLNLDDVNESKDNDFYSIHNIASTLQKRYSWIMEGDGKIVVAREAYGTPGHYRITLYGTTIMSSLNKDALQEEEIQRILCEIINDPELVTEIRALQDGWNKMFASKRQFEERLEHLIKKLKGGYLLEGKCELGY